MLTLAQSEAHYRGVAIARAEALNAEVDRREKAEKLQCQRDLAMAEASREKEARRGLERMLTEPIGKVIREHASRALAEHFIKKFIEVVEKNLPGAELAHYVAGIARMVVQSHEIIIGPPIVQEAFWRVLNDAEIAIMPRFRGSSRMSAIADEMTIETCVFWPRGQEIRYASRFPRANNPPNRS